MALGTILWLAIGIPLGYLISFGVACGIYTKSFGWGSLDRSYATFFASALWFVVLPTLLAYKATVAVPDIIGKRKRLWEKRRSQKYDKGKLPESIESAGEYRQAKLLVEQYERNLPVCER
jgi:hypothetical protein